MSFIIVNHIFVFECLKIHFKNHCKNKSNPWKYWGFFHKGEFQEIYKPRQKRSIHKSYEMEDNHVRLKRTLIHALGNAAHPESLPYLKSYMNHDEGAPSLRRAASHALRHYKCIQVCQIALNYMY